MGKSSAPKPPDPAATAQAQAQANKEAVRESALVNQIGINSPWGRQFYTGEIGDPNRALNIELSPTGERVRSSQEQLAELLSGYGAGTLGPAVLDRLSGEGTDVGSQIYERSIARREPGFERAEERLHSRLLGQGLPPGSRAYQQAMTELREGEDFARSDLALGADIAGLSEDRAQRSQAINELSALLQGAPAIGQPATQMPAQYQVGAPDIEGLTAANYAGRLNEYNTDAQRLGGLYNLGGTLGAAGIQTFGMPIWNAISDRRLKRDIRWLARLKGIDWYTFRYLWSPVRHVGVMAQDLLTIRPAAIRRFGPWLAVDYRLLR